ncbi:MAG: hypothetical protein ACE5JG_11460 [Planctomycetota bacterium]
MTGPAAANILLYIGGTLALAGLAIVLVGLGIQRRAAHRSSSGGMSGPREHETREAGPEDDN